MRLRRGARRWLPELRSGTGALKRPGRLAVAAVALITAACAATGTAPTTVSTEPTTVGTHQPGRGGAEVSESVGAEASESVEGEVSESVGADAGVSPNGGFVSLSADVSCAFRGDGSTECWRRPERPESPGWITIDGRPTGGRCGIRTDGTLQCWDGEDDHRSGDRYEEFPFPGRRFTALSGGYELACAVDVDGALECTPYGYRIDLGDWMPAGEYVSVSMGFVIPCGVQVDGSVGCLNDMQPDGEFVSVSVGYATACGLQVGGEVVCWDFNDELGHAQALPPEALFQAVALGTSFACGLRVDGEVVCWGLRNSGVSGDERDRTHHDRPRGWNRDGGLWPQGPFTALDVSLHDDEICALRPTGEVVCWNNGSATHEPPGGRFVGLDAGSTATCGLRPGGEALCWNTDDGAPNTLDGAYTTLTGGTAAACGLRPGGKLACGLDLTGEITCWHSTESWHEPTPRGPFSAVTVGAEHTCALRPDGTAECWTPHWPPGADPATTARDRAS